MGKPSEYGRNFGYKFSHFGSNTNGHDIKAFGDTTGKYFMWDASADTAYVVGTLSVTGNPAITGNTQMTGTLTVGVDDTGHDVTFFGATSGKKFFFDESADTTFLTCTVDIDGTVTVGVDDTGYDVKFFGATSGSYMLWDESADKLIVNAGTADLGTSCEADAYTVGSVAGADFNGAVTNLTVVKGIVTAAS